MPAKIGFFSLTLIGGTIAIIWTLYIKNTHWARTRKIIKPSLSIMHRKILAKNKSKWTKWLFPLFLICLRFKFLSLIPYTFSQTSHLRITFSLSLPLWLSLQIKGIIRNWKGKLSHLVPEGTPPFLIPIMILIELISLCIQPLTLGFRLGANLLAGHLLIFLCSCVVWTSVTSSPLGVISFLLLFLLFALEIAVAFIQAAVFTILAKQYLEEKE